MTSLCLKYTSEDWRGADCEEGEDKESKVV